MNETRLKLHFRDTINAQLSSRVLAISSLAVLTLVGLIIAVLYASYNSARTNVDKKVDQSVLVFTEFTGKLESDLESTSDALTHTDNAIWTFVLRDLLERQPAIFEALVIDPHGNVLAGRNRVGRKIADIDTRQPWLEKVTTNKGFYIGAVDYQQFGVPFVTTAVAIYDDKGNFVGTLLARTDFTALWELIVRIHVGESGYAYVVDDNGQVMTYRDLELVKNGLSMLTTTGHRPQDVINSTWQILPGLDNKTVIAGSALLGETSWYVIVEQPITEAFFLFFRLLAIFVFVLVVVSWQARSVVVFTQKRVILPIGKLAIGAGEMQKGIFATRVDIQTRDELGNLADAFNTMAASLQQSIETLEERVQERIRDLNIASDVSRQITRVLDLDILLPQLVEKTKEGFNLYYASVYLYDLQTESLSLEAGTGEEVRHMKADAKSFHINTHPSLVAQVAREREAKIVNDIEESTAYFFNSHLPRTKAEADFPMVVGDELVGVLDLQSEVKGRFHENDIQIFSTLAEQIAVAVRNAQLYREQEHVAQELERTDLMKSQFLASMSHELRTPLNAIINFTQLIAMGAVGPVTPDQESMLKTSLKSSRHLLQLINDVLDISKIQAGKLNLFVEEDVNLYDEIKTVIGMTEPLLQKQNSILEQPIQFIQDIDTNLPLIACDRRRIRQVLLNLLSNAIKFTEKGSITLSVKNRGAEAVFAVMDTGHGIPLKMHDQIFEPFVQTADGIKHAEGTGLGLPISRSLVRAHCGNLWMESRIGEGSTFFFTLPFNLSASNW